MHCIVNYEIGTGRASDDNGDDICLEFCLADAARDTVAGYVLIGGELHACRDFGLFGNLLGFHVRPAPSWATLRNIVSAEPSPVATVETQTKCNLEAVAETFNRLSRIERETSQDVLVCETLCGMLVAAGYEVRVDFVSTLVDLYPAGMAPRDLKQTLAIWGIEHTERDHSGPVPPSSFMSAMMTEGLKNDE